MARLRASHAQERAIEAWGGRTREQRADDAGGLLRERTSSSTRWSLVLSPSSAAPLPLLRRARPVITMARDGAGGSGGCGGECGRGNVEENTMLEGGVIVGNDGGYKCALKSRCCGWRCWRLISAPWGVGAGDITNWRWG